MRVDGGDEAGVHRHGRPELLDDGRSGHHVARRQAVEWVNLRVSSIGPIRRPDIVRLEPREGGTDRAVTGSRRVFFEDWVDTPTYNRPDLAPGDVVAGPAVIEEFGSTVPVHPGFAATVDEFGNLLLTKESNR